MKELIERQKVLQKEASELTPLIRAKYKELGFKEKLAVYRELGSGFMGTDDWFTGSSLGGNRVSLYDLFYWERNQSMCLEDIEDVVKDYAEDGDEDFDEDKFDEYLETSEDDRARVFRGLLNDCTGTAIHDW